MEIFTSLGLNETLFVQMGVFLVVFIVLKKVLFEPYFAAFTERRERTVGQTQAAERALTETKELEEKFSLEARKINDQFKAIMDRTRADAGKEYDRLIADARGKSKASLDQSRAQIKKEVQVARDQMSPDVPAVSALITSQLLGKD